MTRGFLVLLLAAAVAAAYLGMYRAWRSRISAQAHIPVPAPIEAAPTLAGPWSGTYLGAVLADRWLDRIAVHTLGERSHATVSVTERGIDVVRPQARSFTVPREDVMAVRADSGIAGHAFEAGGIVVVSFHLGSTPVDIGFRFPNTEDHLAALAALVPEVTS